jgi:hypothetical protein
MRVKQTADGRVRCGGCGQVMDAEYRAQDPAPCGCAWTWNEAGQLEAAPSRADDWWRCTCGRELPEAQGRGTVVSCECGQLWSYDNWALRRWPGDTGTTGLEPRRIA